MKSLCVILFSYSFIATILCFSISNYEKLQRRETQGNTMKSYLDLTTSPCDNFYQHACGNFKHQHLQKTDNTFSVLQKKVTKSLIQLLASQPVTDDPSNIHLKASNFYSSCINEENVRAMGIQPLLDIINKEFGGWPAMDPSWDFRQFDWRKVIARLKLYNINSLFEQTVLPDIKYPKNYITTFKQFTGIGKVNNNNSIIRNGQIKYVTGVLNLMGIDLKAAGKTAEEIIKFDMQLNNIALDQRESQYYRQSNLRITLKKLQFDVRNFELADFLRIAQNRSVSKDEFVVVQQLKYFQRLPRLIKSTEPRIVANFLIWTFVRDMVTGLDRRYEKLLTEMIESLKMSVIESREKLCVANAILYMDTILNSLIVEKVFNNSIDEDPKLMTMINDIKRTTRTNFIQTEWLDDSTLNYIKTKLENINISLGYPESMQSTENVEKIYQSVEISKTNLIDNLLNLRKFKNRREQEALGFTTYERPYFIPKLRPVSTLAMNHLRLYNRVLVPPVLLQQPFYDRYLPKAVNYGALGQLIGHEILHGFDGTGVRFDIKWSVQSSLEFANRTNCLYNQYTKDGIDGHKTLDENIADNGGLRLAYKAYKKWLIHARPQIVNSEHLDGLDYTPTQLFFISAAQVWCTSGDPSVQRWNIKRDPHSPQSLRVNNVVSNMEEFSKEFNCPLGTPMNPKDKCIVW